MAGRRERPLDPEAGPVERFAHELRKLRISVGKPTYRVMATRAGYSVSALAAAASGGQLPSLPVVLAYVSVCGGDPVEWEAHWHRAARALEEESSFDVVAEKPGNQAPYRGLARYEPGDRDMFFGRDPLLRRLTELIAAHRLVILAGASGSGKSSLLRAGLIPTLQDFTNAPVRCAAIRILTPGPRPSSTHAHALDPAPVPDPAGTGTRDPDPGAGTATGRAAAPGAEEPDTVVVVDQFEEVFTLCQDPDERARFLDLLLAARAEDSRLRVVVGVRADFYGHCTQHPGLVEVLRTAHLALGPMTAVELRQAVVGPARAAGLIVERELTSRIVEQTAAEPGGLPLMSHALLEVWRRRRGRTLTLGAYESIGGIHGAVADTAEHTYNQLTPAQAAHARRILLRLITPGEGTPDTRRPASRDELVPDPTGHPDAAAALESLTRARLLVLDGDTADIAHEALITAWPRLANWVHEDRHRLRIHRRLTQNAQNWHDLAHDPGTLYFGTRLSEAREVFLTTSGTADLTPLEHAFLTASHQRQQRGIRRARRLNTILASLLALALVAAGIAIRQRQTAVTAERKAVTAQQAAQSRQAAARSAALLDKDPDLASLLAIHAYRTSPTREAAASLNAAAGLPLLRKLTGSTQPVLALAFSPDGRTLAAGDNSTVWLWNISLPGPADATDKICRTLRRNLTATERSLHLPGHRNQPTCP
ncbi:nSTAND1 domain-containing NTPase [Streptomyces yaizuensis]|uniref:HTH cro/C1-type domain-containing protein n=1 Tax=Streptomyces yaizuensis TaxID=2989713 RepID=A0ABQ5PBI3_9ACTN|nr:ATP-binding protein [Streptomyces sp. YSPA8]GLF99907.1 hypothetical protein SYYSPA8_36440 [Streptomyces sp. YSPA8]